MSTRRVCIPQHVVFRAFASETVVLNLATGKYFGLNMTAGRMLEELKRTHSLDAAAERLAGEFAVTPDTLRTDLERLCEDLASIGLLEIADDDDRGSTG